MSSRWFQFRLRTLFILLTLGCVWLGMQAKQARDQRTAVAAILAAGGQVIYSYQFDANGSFQDTAHPSAPRWLMNRLGEDLFVTVVDAGFYTSPTSGSGQRTVNTQVTNEALRSLKLLPHLRSLGIRSTELTDAGFETIGSLSQLETLTIYSELATDAGVAQLANLRRLKRFSLGGVRFSDESIAALAPLKQLESLELRGGQMSDAGLVYLQQFPALKRLDIYGNTGMAVLGTQITAAGLPAIAKLKTLETLWLTNVNISDADLAPLAQLRNLKTLYLFRAGVTKEGMEKLQASLPKADLSATTGNTSVYASKMIAFFPAQAGTAPANTSGTPSRSAQK